MIKPLAHRCRHAWLVLSGRILLPSDLEGMTLMAELTKTAASIAALSAAADRIIAANQTNGSSAADAAATLASLDDSTSQAINAVTAKIDAAVPPPPPASVEAPAEVAATDPATEQPAQ